MINNLISCVRCKKWFQAANEKQVICDNCANELDSSSVLMWWIAFAASVMSILLYMLFK